MIDEEKQKKQSETNIGSKNSDAKWTITIPKLSNDLSYYIMNTQIASLRHSSWTNIWISDSI